MKENKETQPTQRTISVPTDTLVQIYNLLYSINVRGGDVKILALVQQILEQYLNPTQSKVD